jgi:hypothetical protein
MLPNVTICTVMREGVAQHRNCQIAVPERYIRKTRFHKTSCYKTPLYQTSFFLNMLFTKRPVQNPLLHNILLQDISPAWSPWPNCTFYGRGLTKVVFGDGLSSLRENLFISPDLKRPPACFTATGMPSCLLQACPQPACRFPACLRPLPAIAPVSLPVCCQYSCPIVSLSPAWLNKACYPACCLLHASLLPVCLYVNVPVSLLSSQYMYMYDIVRA